jgi:hypothetical protein
VFTWAMGPLDWRLPLEQHVVRRVIDTVKYHVLKTSYGTWVSGQPKSSPKKRGCKKMCKYDSKESIDCLLSRILSKNIPCRRTLYEIVT